MRHGLALSTSHAHTRYVLGLMRATIEDDGSAPCSRAVRLQQTGQTTSNGLLNTYETLTFCKKTLTFSHQAY